jgi:hypothetical protein
MCVAESVDVFPKMAGLGATGSVDTGDELAAGADLASPSRPRGRSASAAAFSYRLTVSRPTPVACSMHRNDHPCRSGATVCCRLSSPKTFLMRRRNGVCSREMCRPIQRTSEHITLPTRAVARVSALA